MTEGICQFKYIIIGSSGSGKTSILRRLVENKFARTIPSTVGIEYYSHVIQVDGRQIKLMLWDTAGQERYYTIAKAYFRAALGVVLVYDISSRTSFDELTRWLRDSRAEADPNCVVILVGNKEDLASERVVSREEAEDFAKKHDLVYLETSALNNTHIEEVFMRSASMLLQKVSTGEISSVAVSSRGGVPSVSLNEQNNHQEKKKCC